MPDDKKTDELDEDDLDLPDVEPPNISSVYEPNPDNLIDDLPEDVEDD